MSILPQYKMFDASTPPASAPAGYKAVAGYIGGDTPHVWTAEEWARFDGLKKLPIWVTSNPGATAGVKNDAFMALEQLYELGVPKGAAVALDFETAVDQYYAATFQNVLGWAGFKMWLYGSASTLFQNVGFNYWVADYTGNPFIYNHSGVRATQYESGQAYDSSLIKQWDYWFSMARW